MKPTQAAIKSFRNRSLFGALDLLLFTLLWAGSMVLVDKAVLYEWYSSDWISILGIALNAALGVAMIHSYLRYLRSMDEYMRKIQLDALAITVGAGMVGGFSYMLLVTTGLVVEEEVSKLLVLMAFVYSSALVIGMVRSS